MHAGLDVGSRTIKLVEFDGTVRESRVIDTGVNPLRRCQEILSGKNFERVVVTGYGRHLVAPVLHGDVVSEIKAFAIGSHHLFPECHTVIDIGGQDSKVILLADKGNVRKFEMNDRCAAGTGKFLEIMADTLEVSITEIGELALSAGRTVKINSLCTVFAESEVVSLIAKGEETSAIALALHEAIATRIVSMVKRIGPREKIVFAGGGSLNKCLVQLLEQKLETKLTIPNSPQIIGALGAAILAGIESIQTTNDVAGDFNVQI
jgi:(R)-2-hydroxyacyl-CoA dehydratese activating ATPase